MVGLKSTRSEIVIHAMFRENISRRKYKYFTLKINEMRGNYSSDIEIALNIYYIIFIIEESRVGTDHYLLIYSS